MAFLVPTFVACALAGAVAVRRWCGWLTGAPAALAHMVAVTAALVVAHLVAGALTLFTPAAVLACAIVLAALVAAAAWRSRGADRAESHRGFALPARGGRASWVLAGGAAIAVAGCALALIRDVAGAPITSIDALNFQVPIPVRWLQTESVWGLHQFIAEYSNATYPQHGNVLVAAVMLPFDSAFLARLVAVPFWALAAVAVYALARELGAPRTSAILGAAAFAALPVMLRSGLEGVQTDAPMLACFGAGAVFLVRHHRTGARGELVLAGVALGLALGTKWYALTSIAMVGAVWLVARVLAPRGAAAAREPVAARGPVAARAGRVAGEAATLSAIALVAGGFWFMRNWVETGNPLFPQSLRPLFDAPDDPLRDLGGFTLAHYLFDFDVWDRYLRPAFAGTFGWTGVALVAGTVLAAVLLPGSRRARSRPPVYALSPPGTVAPAAVGPVLAVLVASLALAAVYLVTPYSAFGPEGRPVLAAASTRYGLPALLGAAVLTAWAAGRAGRGRVVVELVLALAVLDGLRRGLDLAAGKVIGGCLAAAALVAGVVALRSAMRNQPHGRTLAALGIVVIALGVAGANVIRQRANDQGYGQFDPTLAWIETNAPADRRVALAGIWSPDAISPVLPAFGPRFGNDVVTTGVFRDHFLRAHRTPEPFVAQIASFDLLLVGRGAPPQPEAREERWALNAGWRPVASSQRLALLTAPIRSP